MPVRSTITATGTITSVFGVICAATISSVGWAAPPCWITLLAAAAHLALSIGQDAADSNASGNTGLGRRDTGNRWTVTHANGSQSMHDYYLLGKSFDHNSWVEIYDHRRAVSTKAWQNSTHVHLDMDLNQGGNGNYFSRLFRRAEPDAKNLYVAAQKVGTFEVSDTDAEDMQVANEEATPMYELGNYCQTISTQVGSVEQPYLMVGLTLNSADSNIPLQAPCFA